MSEAIVIGQIIGKILPFLIILLVILVSLLSLYKKRRIFEFSKTIAGPKFYPLIGSAYAILGKDVFAALCYLQQKYSLPCNLWLSHDYHYATDKASDINILLNHPNSFEKPSVYDDFKQLLGNTIFMLPYDIWKVRRKHFAKRFSPTMLRLFVPIFYDKTMTLIKNLKNIEKTTNRFYIFERFAFDGFCQANMGVDIFGLNIEEDVLELFSEMQKILGTRVTNPYIPYSVWLKVTKDGRRLTSLTASLEKFFFKIINDKRENLKANKDYLDSDTLTLADSMLLSEGIRFTNKDIFDELCLFVAAATDTSGSTLAFVFMFLGMHLNVQEKVYEEVMDVVGDHEICYEHLPNLKYTECVIQEAMRLIPVAPVFGRKVVGDIDLGDKILPKNSNVLMSTFHVQRSEKYWKDPLLFNPDRFSAENITKIVPGSYNPFSGGIRNCIGKTYAMVSMKVTVANVVRHFHLTSGYKSLDELHFSSCFTMKTTHNLDYDFTPRHS